MIVVRGEGPLDVVDEFAHAMQANETFDLNTSVLADRRLNGCGRQLIRHQCGWVFVECQFGSSVGEAGTAERAGSVRRIEFEGRERIVSQADEATFELCFTIDTVGFRKHGDRFLRASLSSKIIGAR